MWISRADFNKLKELAESNLRALEKAAQSATLVQIERSGRVNKFTFVRGDKVIQIETMGMISDDFGKWREELLG